MTKEVREVYLVGHKSALKDNDWDFLTSSHTEAEKFKRQNPGFVIKTKALPKFKEGGH